jgi:hypothetical protein
MYFHFGMKSDYMWYYCTPYECIATEKDFDRITKSIHYDFVKDGGKI